jgi:tetratricopeptide (TPR) repeat protein
MMKKPRSIQGVTLRLTTSARLIAGVWTATLALATGSGWAQTPSPLPQPQTSNPAPASEAPATLNEAKAAEVAAQPSSLDSPLFYQLLVGEITAQDGDAAAAFALMLDAARKTNSGELYQRATDIALQSRSGDAALQSARAWKQAQPVSREANRYVLQILIALNRMPETLEPLSTGLDKTPDAERSLAIGAIPRAYARASDKKLAANVVEQALASHLANPATASAAWTTVGRMRLAAGDTTGSLMAAQRAQAVDAKGAPRSEGPALVALELMDPKLPAAEVLVKNYLDGNAQALPEIRMGYARALLDAQRYAEATTQVQTVTREKPDFPDSWLVLGALQLQDNQLAPAQASLERYIGLVAQSANAEERQRGLDQAYLALAQVSEKNKDFKAAEAWIAKIDNSAELVQAQSRRASILASQGKLAEGRLLITQLPARTPEEARAKVSAEAGLLREAKQYREAYNVLAAGIVQTPNDPELIYDQAMMAEKLNDLPQMEKLLRQVITFKPDYHHAYNALGYSFADRNVRLPEAKALIEKALTFAPADPFIQDSLGWVEFRLGNGAKAAQIFETAYKAKPDAEIAAHYGEVLLSLGQRERAAAIFREGLLLAPDNQTLQDTIKRLRVAL